jgi:hypothetical protein
MNIAGLAAHQVSLIASKLSILENKIMSVEASIDAIRRCLFTAKTFFEPCAKPSKK